MIRVGDIVRGKAGNGYNVTNEKMERAVVLRIPDSDMKIKIIKHAEENEHGIYSVDCSEAKFDVIGHVKPFDKEKVTEILNAKRFAEIFEYDLHGADLYGADLREADLRRADLHGADLYGADLREADLRRADLYGADLYGADLHGADLRRADLHGADLREADFNGTNIDYSCLPLSCKGLHIHVDDRIGIQLLYHAVSNILYSKNTSMELKKEVAAVILAANWFHRAQECGLLAFDSGEV